MSDGDFVWYDYLAKDVDKAIEFYTNSIGWKAQAWGDQGYQMWMIDEETAVGGVRELPEEVVEMGATPHWMAFVAVDDVDATVETCNELGGNAVLVYDLLTEGRIAVLRDCDGVLFGAASFEGDMERPDPSQVGAFTWSKLLTSEVQKAFDFYSALFGWDRGDVMDTHLGPRTYQLFKANGNSVGGIMSRPEGMPNSAWNFCITTDDIDAAASRIAQNGGTPIDGPKDVPGGRVGSFKDSQGGVFALHQPRSGQGAQNSTRT